MTSQRLNSVVVLNVQRDLTDELDIPAVADEFVRGIWKQCSQRHIWLTGCLNVTVCDSVPYLHLATSEM